MAKKLHTDIETYSSVSIKDCGAYKYIQSKDFEILLVAYAFDNDPIKVIDLAQGEILPDEFIEAMEDSSIQKWAHNAVFERLSFKAYGLDIPTNEWYCSSIKAAYCGLPLSLEGVSKALHLGEKGKKSTGKALIKYFCEPCKPTKVNGGRTRNLPDHDLEKWESFKEYCLFDVEAEREVDRQLEHIEIPEWERGNYLTDQIINDRGIEVDLTFAQKCVDIYTIFSASVKEEMIRLTGLDNPNSAAQLKKWIGEHLGKEITSLGKDLIPALIEEAGEGTVADVLRLRQKSSKTSIKKYSKMLDCASPVGHRAHGLFQFYGANRTGRWAGRLVQLQNLPQNHLPDIENDRSYVREGDYDLVDILYGDEIPFLLSQLVRTAFVAPKNHTFVVADFSAIEARVIAWLADEKWRLDVFNTTGKIYEASAAMMFNVPIEEITKGSDLRAKGKVSELALGFGGGVGALTVMGAEKMGLSTSEMKDIIAKWREKSPAITRLWKSLENGAKRCIRTGQPYTIKQKGITFRREGKALTVQLPSGRKLCYWGPGFTLNRFGSESIRYMGMNQETKQWGYQETYGGKLTENVIQAIARDLLMHSMNRLTEEGFKIVMHVHDEAICEVEDCMGNPEAKLKEMCDIMGESVPWAEGLPLVADGYITPFYKKD